MEIVALRRRFGVMTVRCQASSLLGRMETLGPGGAAAAGRKQYAADLAARWRKESCTFEHATKEGWRVLGTGFAKFSQRVAAPICIICTSMQNNVESERYMGSFPQDGENEQKLS